MSQHRIPPTPNNFHTWFKYSLGTSSGLKRAIDILVGNKRKFDATTNHDLFAAYVGPQTAADDTDLNTVSQQLHSVMASAKQFLTMAIADNRSQIPARTNVPDQSGVELNQHSLVR